MVLMWKPAEKQEEIAELQSTEQAETTVPMTPEEAAYAEAENLLADGETAKAAIAFGKLGDYKDARQRSYALWDQVAVRDIIAVQGGNFWGTTHAVKEDGTAVFAGGLGGTDTKKQLSKDIRANGLDWNDLIAVSNDLTGLKADGTVVKKYHPSWFKRSRTFSEWKDIVAIDGFLGLRMDGTVVEDSGYLEDSTREEISQWKDIIAICGSGWPYFGLTVDGTIVMAGDWGEWQYDISQWQDIIAIRSGDGFLVGLRADGTVVATGKNGDRQCDVSQWTDVIAIAAGNCHTVGLKSDGTVLTTGSNRDGACNVEKWTDIIAVFAGGFHTVGLKSDGTVVAAGNNTYGQCNVREWSGISLPGQLVSKPKEAPTDQQAQYDAAEKLLADGETAKAAIAFGKLGTYRDARERSFVLWDEVAVRDTVAVGNHHTLGLKNNGTVVVAGQNIRHVGSAHRREVFPMPQGQGQCDVGDWSDIIAVAATGTCSVGLRADGTVVGAGLIGSDESGEIWKEIESWQDIVSITVGSGGVIGLKLDGTVVSTSLDLSDWSDIVAISSGAVTVGLKTDGTVLAAGNNYYKGACNVEQWTDIVAIFAGNSSASGKAWTIGLQSDGTVVATGDNGDGQCNIEDWIDIRSISVSSWEKHITYGIKEDGTVLYAGKQSSWYNASKWEEIVCIAAGRNHAVGLKYDGTVVATGNTEFGRCDVSGWTDIKLPN